MAEYLDVDPSIVRVIWAVLALVTGGLFLVLYIVMWIVVPEGSGAATMPARGSRAPRDRGARRKQTRRDRRMHRPRRHRLHERPVGAAGSGGAVIFGLILIGAGVWFLVDQYLPAFDRDLIWPIALVARRRRPAVRLPRRRAPSSSRPNRANAAALTATSMPAASFTMSADEQLAALALRRVAGTGRRSSRAGRSGPC